MDPDYFFLDGVPLGNGAIVLAAQYNAYADVDASRLLIGLASGWTNVDFDEDVIRSLDYDRASGVLYLLGISGAVYTFGRPGTTLDHRSFKDTMRTHQVVDVEDRGELFKIRVVGQRVLVCGLGGQLLEMRNDVWVDLGIKGSLDDSPDFVDFAIDAQGRPVAVGLGGAMVRFGERGAEHLDVPTNQNLLCIVPDPAGGCYLCGNAGTVYKFEGECFHDMSVDASQANLWAVSPHEGKLYASEPARLLSRTLDSDWKVEQVSHIAKPTFYRLRTHGRELWSIGADHVFFKQADAWQQLPVVGNEFKP